MDEPDLRHLRIFLALYAARNVTSAAEAVGLSQSSVSTVLAQLRTHYGDPLFVRTSGGMQATPRAEQLMPLVRQAFQLLKQSLVRTADFDPAEIRRDFHIHMTDVGQMTLLPGLLSRIHQIAPNVGIEVGNLTHDTARQLETGEVDLAMGFTVDIRAEGFYQQKLFNEGFACIVARDHPRIGEHMTLAELRQERHVKVMLSATAHSIVDKILERKGVQRTFAVQVPTFLGLSRMVATSSLVAIVPLRLGTIFAAESQVKIVSLPIRFPSYVVNQYWHERYHRDPGGIWLRSLVYETANSLPLSAVTLDTPVLSVVSSVRFI
jgi:DNA-binding transcriptional LysR family regulator